MWKKILCMVWGMLFLCGCESVELEERSFPLAVGVDLQEDIQNEEQQLIVSFDFPDLAQISEKARPQTHPWACPWKDPICIMWKNLMRTIQTVCWTTII